LNKETTLTLPDKTLPFLHGIVSEKRVNFITTAEGTSNATDMLFFAFLFVCSESHFEAWLYSAAAASTYAFPEPEISIISLEELRKKCVMMTGFWAEILKRELRNTKQEW
jgi:hypothetical protein